MKNKLYFLSVLPLFIAFLGVSAVEISKEKAYVAKNQGVTASKSKGLTIYKVNTKGKGVYFGFNVKKLNINLDNYSFLIIEAKSSVDKMCVSRTHFIGKNWKSNYKYEPDFRLGSKLKKIKIPLSKVVAVKEGSKDLIMIYFETWMPKLIGKDYTLTIKKVELVSKKK